MNPTCLSPPFLYSPRICETVDTPKTARMRKLKKRNFLIFLVLYVVALILGGATRMHSPDAVLVKILGCIWSLAPSQTASWFIVSLIVLVILIILVFVAGCILIARLENDHPLQKRSAPRRKISDKGHSSPTQ